METPTMTALKLKEVVGRRRMNLTPDLTPRTGSSSPSLKGRGIEEDWQEAISPEVGRLVLELVAEICRGTKFGAVELIIAEGRVVQVKAVRSYKV